MSDNTEPVSAFAVQTAKRKCTEESVNPKKKCLTEKTAVSNKKTVKKTISERKIKDKWSLNVAMNNIGVVTKKGTLKTLKRSFLSAAKKKKFVRKVNSLNKKIQQLDKTNNSEDVQKKLKLKLTKKQKKRIKKKNSGKRKTTELTKISKKQNKGHDLNTSEHTEYSDKEYFNNLNPFERSQTGFQWVIFPLKLEDFFTKNWERTPVHIKRNVPNYYKGLMSTALLDKILRENNILFTKNIDITSYSNGKRETHNPSGRAFPSVVWDYYQNDCSVRMLNPQTFIPKLHKLNATLQEFFDCFVGANSYLTPPNSQGFAPHYDDIEAFILQIEGKKRWRLYMPPSENEYLPRYSSKNFDQSEIGEPILDTIVGPGDLLYLPRGTIHQGTTIDDTHSLHVTLSIYQKNSWYDFLEKLLPQALKRAAETNSHFREGLPIGYLKYTGIAYSTDNAEVESSQTAFKEKTKHLITQLMDYIDIDNAADLMAKGHIHDFLPPFLSKDEQKRSVIGGSETMAINGVVKNRKEITLETNIRLLRSHCIRLIQEDNRYKIYYSVENSKEYHEYEPQCSEVDVEFISTIKKIITSYPNFIRVSELPIEGDNKDDNKILIVADLWEKGLVITDVSL